MQGTPDHDGILQMAASTIFERISSSPNRVFLLRCSYVEIYNENIRDLLDTDSKPKIREDATKGVFLDCKEEIITSMQVLLDCKHQGERNRSVGVTNMNEQSSRSHTIFRVVVESKERPAISGDEDADRRMSEEDVDGAVLVATLNLVDLAGSESVRLTGAVS